MDNYILVDENLHVRSPTGIIFFEKRQNTQLIIEYQPLQLADTNPEFQLNYLVDSNNIHLKTEVVEHYKYISKIAMSKLACGLYELVLGSKIILQFTVSAEFSNIQMTTIFTHQMHSIIDKIEKLPYNWLHITPLHKPGSSKSAYSLYSYNNEDFQLSPEEIKKLGKINVMADVVLNHLSPNSPLLTDINHTFNTVNRPDFKGAAVFDFHLWMLEQSIIMGSEEGALNISSGVLYKQLKENDGAREEFIQQFVEKVDEIYTGLKLFEFELIKQKCHLVFEQQLQEQCKQLILQYEDLVIYNGHRNGASINVKKLEQILNKKIEDHDQLVQCLKQQNNNIVRQRIYDEKQAIVNAVRDSACYELFGKQGVDFSVPPNWFLMSYFQPVYEINSSINTHLKIKDEMLLALKSQGFSKTMKNGHPLLTKMENNEIVLAACNGWTMGEAFDFAARSARVYQKRQLISWGDCVKLNYQDNEELQKIAEAYVVGQAKLFSGLRIDNAHSTPPDVLKRVNLAARKVNKDLVVMLEVFSGSPEKDATFIQSNFGDLGVKEMLHSTSVNALCALPTIYSVNVGQNVLGDYIPANSNLKQIHRLSPIVLFDQTHDNTPIGSIFSAHGVGNVPVLAAISVASQGVAHSTVFGLDFGVTQHIQVVDQTPCFSNFDAFSMHKFRQILLEVTDDLQDFCRVYAHDHGNFMTIERQNEVTQDSYIFVCAPDFKNEFEVQTTINMEGTFDQFVGGIIKIEKPDFSKSHFNQQIVDYFNSNKKDVQDLSKFSVLQKDALSFDANFKLKPGTVIIFKKKIQGINQYLKNIKDNMIQVIADFGKLNLLKRKQFLISSGIEDSDYGVNFFNFEGLKPTVQGFDGFRDLIMCSNHSSSVAQNIRTGNWFIDFIISRHDKMSIKMPTFDKLLGQIKDMVPSSYRPLAFYNLYQFMDIELDKAVCQLNGWENDKLKARLYRAGLLLVGFRKQWANVDVNKWVTDDFKSNIQSILIKQGLVEQPKEPEVPVDKIVHKKRTRFAPTVTWKETQSVVETELLKQYLNVSLAAGYEHFFDGMFRSWGRDINLSITGLLTITDQILSRIMIVSTLSLVRHGLLPNLQDSGRSPRYNCRDAVWYLLGSLIEYMKKYKDNSILDEKLIRIFLSDNESDYLFDQQSLQHLYTQDCLMNLKKCGIERQQTVRQVIVEILEKHYKGIEFEEWKCHDDNMKPEGKFIKVIVDKQSGLIYGGSQWNCGTWMDKMGGSALLGNRGFPATSRHGADVEINLCAYAAINFLAKDLNIFFVNEWMQKLNSNISKFVMENQFKDVINYENDKTEQENLLRPNYLIGLSYCSDEFVKQYEKQILYAFKHLLEPHSIGMKTLAPYEKRYSPWYNNDDTSSFETANGFSYHNGPEWVHCMGRALICLRKCGISIEKYLFNIRKFLDTHCNINGDCRALPELTNNDANCCWNSCVNQNWAIAGVLQALVL